jgi:hypothetical protein
LALRAAVPSHLKSVSEANGHANSHARYALSVRFHVEILDLESDAVTATEHDADDWSGALSLAWQDWDRVYPRRPSRGRVIIETASEQTDH